MSQNTNTQLRPEGDDSLHGAKVKRPYTPNIPTGRLTARGGIPLPEKDFGGRVRGMPVNERLRILGFTDLPVSHMIECTDANLASVGLVTKYQREHLKSDLYHYAKHFNKSFTIRKIEGGYGVWRVK